ncbi:uncharacterized protein LOC142362089 isoform X2 [Opisthocomus hoazin]
MIPNLNVILCSRRKVCLLLLPTPVFLWHCCVPLLKPGHPTSEPAASEDQTAIAGPSHLYQQLCPKGLWSNPGTASGSSYLQGEDRQVTGLTEKEGEKEREASEAAVSPGNAESESCGGEEPNDWSYRRRREERRREKHLKCQSLLAAPRARAAWPAPCSSFLAATVQQRIIPGAD